MQAACNITSPQQIPEAVASAWKLDPVAVERTIARLEAARRRADNEYLASATENLDIVVQPDGEMEGTDSPEVGTINERDAFGMTAAHMAIIRGDLLTFLALLKDPVRACFCVVR